jgi:hypothetical protein
MWVAGDGIMFGLMMLVFLMWSMDDRAALSGHGWLETARKASLAHLVASHQHATAGADAAGVGAAPGQAAAVGGPSWSERGGVDDDEHLAAYNAFLARLNQADPGRPER